TGILLDLQGPKIWTGDLKEGAVPLVEGAAFVITTEEVPGDASRVSTTYKGLPSDLREGGKILIDDGLLELRVEKVTSTDVHCRVIRGGILKNRKGINIPGAFLQVTSFTEKDQEDLRIGIEEKVDFVALSFVRTPGDILKARDFIKAHGGAIPLIAKIEKPEAVDNLDRILAVSDGIMVARGDLGVEISPEKVPIIQKEIIRRCNEAGLPVITATQMLESMINCPYPTRAEASDVANAILDGTDAVMLSGETAVGKYPVETVAMMQKIAQATEGGLFRVGRPTSGASRGKGDSAHAIAHAVYDTAMDLDAKAIVTFSRSGATALLISKYRPRMPVITATHSREILPRLSLYWGVQGVFVDLCENTDEMIRRMERTLLEKGFLREGDSIIITLGVPLGVVGSTNMLMVHRISQ
ncbi:MAG: pyruvate kinase, partial [Nitrospirae bacterium]|nr:pyruvate kinase [Nitrospirota bacterium]